MQPQMLLRRPQRKIAQKANSGVLTNCLFERLRKRESELRAVRLTENAKARSCRDGSLPSGRHYRIQVTPRVRRDILIATEHARLAMARSAVLRRISVCARTLDLR